ncbi:hypothetical protein ACFLT2_13595 [Acidobacteriota bacterium]
MSQIIEKLEQLEKEFLKLRDQAAAKEEHFRGVDAIREGKMEGYRLAYTLAAWEVHQVIESLAG